MDILPLCFMLSYRSIKLQQSTNSIANSTTHYHKYGREKCIVFHHVLCLLFTICKPVYAHSEREGDSMQDGIQWAVTTRIRESSS